jgi:aminoglycoside phosphotransferase (APT) family kinase protein
MLARLAPGSSLLATELLPGSFSNYTHRITARASSGSQLDLVVRRYAVFGDYDRGEKARREFKAIQLANANGVPTPEPLLLDETGEVLGSPGIVTSFVPGELLLEPPARALAWVRGMASMLARIHTVPFGPVEQEALLDADAEASWFARSSEVPAYMTVFAGGDQVWLDCREAYGQRRTVRPGLVHLDYWSGNILWSGSAISAVLDWEEAAWGDPAIDVAYARMNLALMGLPALMDEFLSAYEVEAGRRLENLGLWELAAAVRPMVDVESWEMTASPQREVLSAFIAAAMERALD